VPDRWTAAWSIPCFQMILPRAPSGGGVDFVPLDASHSAEMVALADLTVPGPFGSRTCEFGGYIGVRDGGRLVAMAGERLRLPGLTEISAVCTDAEHRGRGIAAGLVTELVRRIRERDEVPFLHVMTTNVGAIRVYAALGFEVRREIEVVGVKAGLKACSRGRKIGVGDQKQRPPEHAISTARGCRPSP